MRLADVLTVSQPERSVEGIKRWGDRWMDRLLRGWRWNAGLRGAATAGNGAALDAALADTPL